ncbi:hypothetical protein FACS1894159_03800 [Bacteroidia bacterium]|nr:hypothetical protein FACS1894159_03800 [Bacteroidia bacterium]
MVAGLFFLTATFANAQTIKSIQEQIRSAQEEIRANNRLLDKNRKEQKMTVTQLKLIENKIENRRRIISSLESQITILTGDIGAKSSNIDRLNRELEDLRREYADMVRVAYKNYKINNFALFVFSAQDFSNATRRIALIERYNLSREMKAAQIDSLSRRLTLQVAELKNQKRELDQIRTTRGGELVSLSDDQQNYRNSAAQLKASEAKLSSTVRARQQQIEQAQRQIRRIMTEEARKAKTLKRSAEEQRQITAMTGRFDQNMGRMSFPVTGGVVIERYGRHSHPTENKIVVNNPGINILAPRGSDVRCVFDGVVGRVFFHPTVGNGVLINHGQYNTIYSNLASVTVKQGDKVASNQRIGNISNSDNPDENRLHFEIWRGMTTMDPSLWLRR